MLDPQLKAILEMGRAAGTPELCDLPPMAARGLYQTLCSAFDLAPAPASQVETQERLIDGPGGKLSLRVFRPTAEAAEAPGMALYLHGGGFVVGNTDCYQAVCSNLCLRAGCIVVAVDYRLAPEHPFPAAVDDAYAALEWLAAHGAELGGNGERLAVVGDSAGANLAAVMALLARDREGPPLAFQGLVYPVTAPVVGQFASYEKFGQGYVLTTRVAAAWLQAYFNGAACAPDFRGAPLLAEDLSGLPPALVQVAGYDPLRDEGIVYANRMMEAEVPVTLVDYPTLSHGYINMAGKLPAADLALHQLAAALRQHLAGC